MGDSSDPLADLNAAPTELLLKHALEGDERALSVIYVRHRALVHRTCFKYLRHHHEAEDAVQETFLRAWRKLDTCAEPERFAAWLARIATRVAIDRLRNAGRQHHALGVDDWAGDWTADAVLASDDLRRVGEALARLPSRHRHVFLSHALEGRSCADLAADQETSVSAIKSLLFRVRAVLRDGLGVSAALLGVRRLRARVAMSVRRINVSVAAAPAEAGYASAIVFLTAAVTLGLLGGGIVSRDVPGLVASGPPGLRRTASWARHAEVTHTRAVDDAGEALADAGLEAAMKANSNGRGPAPRETRLTLRVRGPNGRVLVENETWMTCDGVGTNSIPKNGSVEVVC